MYYPEPESYPAYYHSYIQKHRGKEVKNQLNVNKDLIENFYLNLPTEKHEYAYDQGKWTPKDILLHLVDTERVFAYRALKIARGDGRGLSSFDQDIFVNAAHANRLQMSDIIKQYQAVRMATIALFDSIDNSTLNALGDIEGHAISVGALGFIILGHETHHLEVIKECYL